MRVVFTLAEKKYLRFELKPASTTVLQRRKTGAPQLCGRISHFFIGCNRVTSTFEELSRGKPYRAGFLYIAERLSTVSHRNNRRPLSGMNGRRVTVAPHPFVARRKNAFSIERVQRGGVAGIPQTST